MSGTDRIGAEEFKSLLIRVNAELRDEVMPTLAEQWKNEGKIDGLRSGVREDVLEVLESRFGVFARPLRAQVEAVEDLSPLKALLRTAVTAGSVEELRKGL